VSLDDSPLGPGRVRRPRTAAFALVLAGVAVFLVGSFLPYVRFEARVFSPSLYEMQTMRHSGLGWVGAVLLMFTGALALAVVAILGIRRSRTSTASAMLGISIVWVLQEIGFLLGANGLWPTKAAGYWAQVLAVVIVIAGASSLGVSLLRPRVPGRPDTLG
jgi:hypothetical protein